MEEKLCIGPNVTARETVQDARCAGGVIQEKDYPKVDYRKRRWLATRVGLYNKSFCVFRMGPGTVNWPVIR